jgi:hypothetical protein
VSTGPRAVNKTKSLKVVAHSGASRHSPRSDKQGGAQLSSAALAMCAAWEEAQNASSSEDDE